MKLLLDTHVLIWWTTNSKLLSRAGLAAIRSKQNDLFVSSASAWEIAIKVRLGKLTFDQAFLAAFDDSLRANNFTPLAVTAAHASTGAQLAGAHNDPFDRLLAGQALVEQMHIVSADPAMTALGVPVVW